MKYYLTLKDSTNLKRVYKHEYERLLMQIKQHDKYGWAITKSATNDSITLEWWLNE